MYGFSAPPWTDAYVDGTIKPASQWDPTQYFNVWVLDISGGILGWAQFPEAPTLSGIGTGNGSANTDGVVVLYSSVGSMATPFGGGNGAYDNGRTLTHEAGHWLGLRHIWGDGGCTLDDFCNDTPRSSTSNFGCPTINHCNDGNPDPNDMVENYMDYTDDDCMDVFTTDQKDRMQVVMGATGNPSPRRAELNDSPVCNVDPCYSFAANNITLNELSHCEVSTIQIGVNLNFAINTATSVTLEIDNASTATFGVDYTVSSLELNFPANFTGIKYIDVNILGDGIVESSESIVFNIAAISGTSFGVCSLSNRSVTIEDNDVILLGTQLDYQFLFEDFNDAPISWEVIDGGSNSVTWVTSTLNGGSNLNGTNFALCSSEAAGSGSTTYETLISPIINTINATSLNLDFDQYFRQRNNAYNEKIIIDVWDGISWINVYTRLGSDGSIGNWGAPNHQTINILNYKNSEMKIRFIYDAANDRHWAIDNVEVSGDLTVVPQSSVNSSSGFNEQFLGPNQTVYFNDINSNNIMMKLENMTNHDYGCTKVEVNREGINYFSAGTNAHNIADKTFKITPTNNTAAGSVKVTLYYTAGELAPWTSNNNPGCEGVTSLSIINSQNGIASTTGAFNFAPTTQATYNSSDVAFTATIDGLIGGMGLSDQISGNAFYVKHNATGSGTGGSFENGFINLHDALMMVNTCPSMTEIRIAQGTYLPDLDQSNGVPSNSTEKTYFIDSDITILGGFEGLSSSADVTDITARDFNANPTILSGDHNNDDGAGMFSDNSLNVIKIGSQASSLNIDGVNITAAKGGSGLYCNGSLLYKNGTISDCTNAGNGAGIYLLGTGILILDNVLMQNNSTNDVFTEVGTELRVIQSVILKD